MLSKRKLLLEISYHERELINKNQALMDAKNDNYNESFVKRFGNETLLNEINHSIIYHNNCLKSLNNDLLTGNYF